MKGDFTMNLINLFTQLKPIIPTTKPETTPPTPAPTTTTKTTKSEGRGFVDRMLERQSKGKVELTDEQQASLDKKYA